MVLKNKSGQTTLIMIAIIAALGVFLALRGATLFQSLLNQGESSKNFLEKKMAENDLRVVFASENCAKLVRINNIFNREGTFSILINEKAPEKNIFSVGAPYGSRLKVKSMTVTEGSPNTFLGGTDAQFTVAFTRANGSAPPMAIGLKVNYNANEKGELTNCTILPMAQEACQTLGARWVSRDAKCDLCALIGAEYISGQECKL